MPTKSRSFDRLATMAAVAIVVGLGWFLVTRPGYSPDEEITVFAVRGILSAGVPVMPSGWSYWRGAAYSYLSAAAAALTGETLHTCRTVSLAAAVVAAGGMGLVAPRVAASGGAASLLLAVWPSTAALSGYARFYAPFLALYVTALVCIARVERDRKYVWWFVVVAVMARAVHEFAISLVLVPIAAALASPLAGHRRRFIECAIASTAAVGLTHAALTLPQAAGDATVSRWGFNSLSLPATTLGSLPALRLLDAIDVVLLLLIFVAVAIALQRAWQADGLFMLANACAATIFALGTIVAITVTAALLRPARAARTALAALVLLVVASIVWLAVIAARTDTALSPAIARDLVAASLRFPFSGAQRLVFELPILTATTIAGVAWTVRRARQATDASAVARALASTLWLNVLVFGVFDVDLRARYFALMAPLLALFAGAVPAAIIVCGRRSRHGLAKAGAVAFSALLIAGTVFEQHRFTEAQAERSSGAWWGVWAPPTAQKTLDAHHAPHIDQDDIVVSNDELASVWRLGRVDYWTPPSPAAELLSYSVTDGTRRGLYAGGQVLHGLDQLKRLIDSRGARTVSMVLFDTGKFGIGHFDRAAIAELPGAQVSVTEDWTLARWAARRSLAQ